MPRYETYEFLIRRGFIVTGSESSGRNTVTVLQRNELRLRVHYDVSTGTVIEFANTPYDAWSPLRAVLWKLGLEATFDPWADLGSHIDAILRLYDSQYASGSAMKR